MMDESSALATIEAPPAEQADEYDEICAAILASARGRWFLQEHARRSRHADVQQALAAIGRIECVIRERSGEPYQSFGDALRELARLIADTPSEAVEPQPHTMEGDADSSPVAEVVQPSDDAFAIAERIRNHIRSQRECGTVASDCEQIEALVEAILSAPALRDPADRRAQQLADVLGHLERRVRAMPADAMAVEIEPEPAEPRSSVEDFVASPPPGADFVSSELQLSPLVPAEAGTQRLEDQADTGGDEVRVDATEMHSAAELQVEPAAVVRTVLAAQTDPPTPRTSASLLEGLNAFTDLTVASSLLPPSPPVATAMAKDATLPPDNQSPVAGTAPADSAASPKPEPEPSLDVGQVRAPLPEPSRAEPSPPDVPLRQPAPVPQAAGAPEMRTRQTTAGDPLAALMALSDEERIALFS